MSLMKFAISLDQPVYYSGQTISGKLVVQIDKPMVMRAIYLKYSGHATVRWTEIHRRIKETRYYNGTKSRTTENYTETYSNVEHYLGLQQLVFGSDTEDCELAVGEHVYDFNCKLPMNLPSSFEGLYGHIRYSVTATITRSWKFNHVAKQPITVMSVFDLNHNTFAAAPVAEQTSKTFWGHSKNFLMSVNLPVRGFVPGQVIPIKVSLDNNSGVQIKSLYVSLKQNVTFHAVRKSRTVKMYVFKNEFPVPNGLGCEEVSFSLQLPAVPPSYLEFSKIIDLNYQLNVTAKVKAWYHKNLEIDTEVIVGNIPLMSYQRPISVRQLIRDSVDLENPSNIQELDNESPAYGDVVPPGTMYKDLPPPTYEQCLELEGSESENRQQDPKSAGEVTDFVPLYPVYKFETTQS